jgi:hypothetical protein
MEFVVDKVEMLWIFLQLLLFTFVCIIPQFPPLVIDSISQQFAA